jgi:hypothetical protein
VRVRESPSKGGLFLNGEQVRLIEPCGVLKASHRLFDSAPLFTTESLILAQNERWRRGLGMQVVRERGFGS